MLLGLGLSLSDPALRETRDQSPLGLMGPDDVAWTVRYLASDATRFVTTGAVGVFLVFTNRESCPGNRANLRKHADQPHQSQSTAVALAGQ